MKFTRYFFFFILFSCFNSKENFTRISLFENSIHTMTITFNRNGNTMKQEYYINDTISLDVNYTYYKNKFKNIVTREGELDLYLSKIHSDYLISLHILKEKNVSFKFPKLISSNIRDIAKVLSIAVNTENNVKDNIRTILVKNINKRIRFTPSTIE